MKSVLSSLRILSVFVFVCLGQVVAVQAEEEEGELLGPQTIYLDLQPSIVTNYGGAGPLRYLRADVALRIDASAEPDVIHHMPYIRHRIVMLLGRQTEDTMASMEGKELIRQQALEDVREIMIAEVGEQKIQDVLFSSFVVQR